MQIKLYEKHLPTGTPAEVEMPAPHITITFLAEEDSRRRHRESRLVPPPVAARDCDEPIVHGAKREIRSMLVLRYTFT